MKKTLSVIVLLLACAVLISGITLAYFYDNDGINSTLFTVGCVKIKVDVKDCDWYNWKPGEKKTITWYFTNTGTLPATLDVEIRKEWSKKNNNRNLFELFSLNTSNENEGYNKSEEYNIAPADAEEPEVSWILQNDNWEQQGSTIINDGEQFIGSLNLTLGKQLFSSESLEFSEDSEGIDRSLSEQPDTDVYHYITPIAPDETIPLTFDLILDDIPEGYEGADYNISLFVTATQVIDE